MAYLHFNTMALETGVTMAGTDWSAYRAHQVVWQFFGDHADRDRDFLYRFDLVRGEPFFSALSLRPPRNMAGIWDLRSTPFDLPELEAGMRFPFALRAHPTRSRSLGSAARGQRFDLIRTHDPKDDTRLGETCAMWLHDQAIRHGFRYDPETLRVADCRLATFWRKGRWLTLGMADFAGALTVTDPAAFTTAMVNGIGRGKSFGCGLLLVGPYADLAPAGSGALTSTPAPC